MEIVETWYFQIWVNFGGMAVLMINFQLTLGVYDTDNRLLHLT